MGKTYKDRNKFRRFRDEGYDSYNASRDMKQNAKRFRQDRNDKRSVQENDDRNE